jgi:hypothetical protein
MLVRRKGCLVNGTGTAWINEALVAWNRYLFSGRFRLFFFFFLLRLGNCLGKVKGFGLLGGVHIGK